MGMQKLQLLNRLTTPIQRLLIIYLGLITIGALLLSLPGMTTGEGIHPIDALFTSTSAVCVTGLITVDTATAFTFAGQFVILVLIQLGGLGIIIISTLVLISGSGKLSIASEEMLSSTVAFDPKIKFREISYMVFKFSLLVEILGAVLLFFFWQTDDGIFHRGWYSIFHSVSAFCNAGFSVFSNSLENYTTNPGINFVVMGLIITGGFGFINFKEMQLLWQKKRFHWRHFSLFLKVSVCFTPILIVFGAAVILFFDYHAALGPYSLPQKILASVFQSVTTRTAGFDTISMEHFTNASLFTMMLLMFVGGGSGSTAGGIKITSVAALIAAFRSRLRNSQEVFLFKRRLAPEIPRKTSTLFVVSEAILILAVLLLQATEVGLIPHTEIKATFLEYAFEAFSAFGTVGLSTGVTSTLSPAGKILIIFLMYVGRLGPLTLLIAWLGKGKKLPYSYPEENLPIG
jgi:trk system potassium uptake protein TrkH